MRYRELQIETQRQPPNNARTEGFAFLARAGYVTRGNDPTRLGEYAIEHLRGLAEQLGESFLPSLALPLLVSPDESYFAIKSGSIEVIHCPACGYADRAELARFKKGTAIPEDPLPLEKVLTPDCNTIDSLAGFLGIPTEKTAKALMYTRPSDGKFIFVIVRGDMQLSESKLRLQVGEVRPATVEEIRGAGAAAGYASPIGLKDALIIVDDLIPGSNNLAAGANQPDHHLKNVNYGRDFTAGIVADLVLARLGDPCPNCDKPLILLPADILATRSEYRFENLLLALGEIHHDDRGLTLPKGAAPFSIYLMHLPGREMDTRSAAEGLYLQLQEAGLTVLFDDRDERAGVKFNDADLIGCPVRITVGEKGLKDGMVELKPRREKENRLIPVDRVIEEFRSIL
jgi:prolyl-tRNA synthetase